MHVTVKQAPHEPASAEPLAQWMFIHRDGLDKTNAVLAEMFPGSEGFKAVHKKDADDPFFFRLTPRETLELRERVGANPDTGRAYITVHNCLPHGS